MRGNALRHPNAQESAASAKARLTMLLTNATDSRLASFTADSLAATHRVKFGLVAEMLDRERGRRNVR